MPRRAPMLAPAVDGDRDLRPSRPDVGAPSDRGPAVTPSAGRRGLRLALLVALVGVEATWLATRDVLEGGARWIPLLVAIALHGALVLWEHRRPVLGPRTVLLATAAVALVAVVVPPFGSRDLYLYASYGRMLTWHHVNPYLSAPDAVAGDALTAQVAHAWRSVPTAYGPVFTGWSAVGALLYGDSPLRARLFFQASAAGALLAATWYLLRRGRSTATLLAVGLSPVLVAAANGGHNDLLAGLAAMVGVDLVTRRRTTAGALLVGVACGVKLLLLPVAGVVVLASLVAGRRREALRAGGLVAGVLVGGYLLAGGPDALAPLRDLNDAVSRGSLWGTLSRDPSANLFLRGDGWAHPLAGLVIAAGLGLVAWRARRPIDVAVVATAAGVVVCFGADYTLPWYAAAFLLVGALAPSVPTWALALGATVQLLVYVQPPGVPMGDLVGAINAALLGGAALAVLLVGTVAWVVVTGWHRPLPRPGAVVEDHDVEAGDAVDDEVGPVLALPVSRRGS